MTSPADLAQRLPHLIDELRETGYRIGIDQYVAAQDLMIALAGRGDLPDDASRYRTLLGPIFCKSAQEQEDFSARFERWIARGPSSPRRDPSPSLRRELDEVEQGARVWRRGLVAGSIAALILAVFIYLIPRPSPRTSARQGDAITSNGIPKVETLTPPPVPGLVKTDKAIAEVEPVLTKPPEERPSGGSVSVAVLLTTLFLLVAGLLGWRLWWVHRARLFLMRRMTSELPDVARVSVKGAGGELFRDLGLDRMAQRLRQRRPIESGRIDVRATVLNTVRNAGWFTPVPGRSLLIPEYLVLIDRASYHDHQAKFFDELMDRLAKDEVIIALYEFDGDPRTCHPASSGADVVTIRDLAARYPLHRLLIISSGVGLIDPLSGEVVTWADQFGRWPERVLLTPEGADHWGYRERALAQHGLLVLPASVDGLAVLASDSGHIADPGQNQSSQASPPFPELLRERPRRWMERHEPAPDVLSGILGELRAYLGEDGYEWLGACAVYPALHWDLTLHLGYRLRSSQGRRLLDLRRLAALGRLPWFRHGAMPDWLRMALIQSLPRDQEKAIRAALQVLLMTASEGESEGLVLEIAHSRRTVLAPLARQIFRTLYRRAQGDSPLRDYVFASFMSGRRPSALAMELPGALRGLFLLPRIRPKNPGIASDSKGEVVDQPLAARQVHSDATPNSITNSIGVRLTLIPPGTFLMGSTGAVKYASDSEKPRHEVRITKAFYLGIHEVTQGQYKAVTGKNPSHFKGSDDLPVEQVSWLDAVQFCNRLSERESLQPYYRKEGGQVTIVGGNGYRLPTEAEWEYACRAGSGTAYGFGDDAARLGEFAWFDGNSEFKTNTVGQKQPNAFGLYDMNGNVWEWCWDGYDSEYYKQSPVDDPSGPVDGTSRVIRGGSWNRAAEHCRAAYRNMHTPTHTHNNLGLRLARVLSGL